VATKRAPLQIAIRLGVYVLLCFITLLVFGGLFSWFENPILAAAGSVLVVGVLANWLVLRIFDQLQVADAGLHLSRASAENLAIGLAGGVGSAALVLGPPLLVGAAHLVPGAGYEFSPGSIVFLIALLAAGALGEELMIHGYAFQLLVREVGAWATIIPVAIIFALLHGSNPASSWLSTAITAGFGIIFGYSWLRSRDLWLPIGLHFGWNFTLPLFGVNISGLKIRMTGYELSWTAGTLWSGGDYGPEASMLTLAAIVLLMVFIHKAPVRRQFSPIVDRVESAECEPLPPSPPVLPS
jgi:membrane protease YdiL (CAAX protease family)